jgi:putative FmdB family regulatory protein
MPLYEFLCLKCDEAFTELLSVTDDSLPPCPQCGDTNIKKLPSAASFRVKGFSASNHYGLKGAKK